MNNKFISVNMIVLFGFLALFVIANIAMSVMNDNMNKKVDILTSKLIETELDIVVLRNQIEAYESYRTGLETTISSQKGDIEQLSYRLNEIEDPPEVDKSTADNPNIRLLAQLIESESGNQSFKGKLAVGTVVMNRVNSDQFPDTIRDVIFQKRQFSVVANGSIHNEPSEESLKAAKEILNGKRTLDSDVLYFYNPKIVSKTNWVRSRDVQSSIGDHSFAS